MSSSEKWFINEEGEPYLHDEATQADEFPMDDHTPYPTEAAARAAADADLPQVVEMMSDEIENALRQGAVMLKGDVVSVQLYATVEDAQTPQEAVERFIRMVAHAGFDSFYFAVTDQEAGETHYVRAGQLLNLGEIEAVAEGQDDGS